MDHDCNSRCKCGRRACDLYPCEICYARKGKGCNLRVHFPEGLMVARGEGVVLVPWEPLRRKK